MAPGDEKLAADAFVGYNEWAAEALQVQVATDFVYEQQEGACEAERGVFIAEDVTPHTEVFSIPLDSVLSVQSLQDSAVLQSIAFFQQLSPEREDDQLAIALLYERFVLGAKSKWAKHIELLPRTYHNVLYFSQEELRALEGSNVFFVAQQMEEKVSQDFARLKESVLLELFENITEGINVDLFDEFFSLENYKWALSTIWSRFVSLRLDGAPLVQQKDEPVEENSASARNSDAPVPKQSFKAMVPVFDMLNHDPEAEMSHFFDMATQRFKLVSHQHWNAGAQMFINYGPLSNHKLLSLYGFVIIGNPFDAVEMWLPMDEASTKFFQEKEQLLFTNGLDHATNPFELVADESNDLLLVAARIQEINCETVEEFEELANKALYGEMVSLENEQEVLSRLIYTLEKMLEAFPTSIEEDDKLLESWESDLAQQDDEKSDSLNHERMAVAVRRSDKYILSENINMLKWKLLDILPKN
ncbi:putative histone-lysine N-methyltransferase [Phytophthora cinnamomi]|uniref:putative histone-lysine N-methyltransferase n=1 Tax=Phytophthora cinnamomi TaxID=4785 RepID=UPI003559F511|nr:putative histone-lysine N-methyltransferase [Phytophthora cinnamomi]